MEHEYVMMLTPYGMSIEICKNCRKTKKEIEDNHIKYCVKEEN